MSTLDIFNLTAAVALIALIIIAALRERRARKHSFDLGEAIEKVRFLHETGVEEFTVLRDNLETELRELKTRHEDDLVELIQRHDRFARGNLEQAQRMNELTATKIVEFNEQNKNHDLEIIVNGDVQTHDTEEFAEMIARRERRK